MESLLQVLLLSSSVMFTKNSLLHLDITIIQPRKKKKKKKLQISSLSNDNSNEHPYVLLVMIY
jgi:hypothetical protein